MPSVPAAVLECQLAYGLRVSDVIDWKTSDLDCGRWTIHEKKTDKARRIQCTGQRRERLRAISKSPWVFPGRRSHITRQAVWSAVRRACERLDLEGCIGTHSFRKAYAEHFYFLHGVHALQKILNHDRISTTLIYAVGIKK